MSPSLLLLLSLLPSQELPFEKEIAEFRRQDAVAAPEKGQIVFIGSSSFARWTTVSQAFPGRKILNRAFGGSQLSEVTVRLKIVVFPYEPRQVVLYCGENDFAASETLEPSVVVERFKDLFDKVLQRLPNVKFVYVSMKPSPARWHLAPKFRSANDTIRKFLLKQKRTAFVDVWPVMLTKDGRPKPEIFVEDKLHLNEAGYKLWTPLLDKVLIPHRGK